MRNSVRHMRQARGLEQAELARLCGVSRQALGNVEAGKADPSTSLALAIAGALRCSVEDLFQLPDSLKVHVAPALSAAPLSLRAALAEVGDRWIAHALPSDALSTSADALLPKSGAKVRPLRPLPELRERILAVGCDPALGLLAAHVREVLWLQATSTSALQALARGEAHVAGAHLFGREYLAQQLPGRAFVVVNLARWREGLAVARRNPLGIHGASDLHRARIVNREAGAGARALLDRLLQGRRPRGYDVVLPSHAAVAQAVAMGAADAGVTTESAALALGLGFVPLSDERSDLVLPLELAKEPRGVRLVEALQSRAFRRDLGAIAAYDASHSGEVQG